MGGVTHIIIRTYAKKAHPQQCDLRPEVSTWHARYIQELQRVYNENKGRFGEESTVFTIN